MGYDRVDQIREGVSGDGLEGNSWEEGLSPCIQSQLEYLHGWSVYNLLWHFCIDLPSASSDKARRGSGGPHTFNIKIPSTRPTEYLLDWWPQFVLLSSWGIVCAEQMIAGQFICQVIWNRRGPSTEPSGTPQFKDTFAREVAAQFRSCVRYSLAATNGKEIHPGL